MNQKTPLTLSQPDVFPFAIEILDCEGVVVESIPRRSHSTKQKTLAECLAGYSMGLNQQLAKEANAEQLRELHLRVAAPELVDALEMMVNGLQWYMDNHPLIINECDHEAVVTANIALAKARGEGQ